jgi:NAD(P)H dehydrogenase (quinone)
MYGHIYRMAEAVAEGAREVEDVEVSLHQVAELVPDAALERTGAKAARAAFAHVPVATVDQLSQADAIIFGTPTRFGNMAVIVGVPCSEPGLTQMDAISGGTPYGATTLAKGDGSRQPSDVELTTARFQGRHVAQIAKKLKS